MNARSEAGARAEIVVDLRAIAHNIRRLRQLVGDRAGHGAPALMVVVKADGYGHGMVQVARTARAVGAEWLGVATLDEALALRESGDTGRLLCWLAVPDEDYAPAVDAGVDVSAYSVGQLEEIVAAARRTRLPARLQLKFDTGLSRGGAPRPHWQELVEAAAAAESAGRVQVTGVWSHFACSDEPAHPANDQQERQFGQALALVEQAGLQPEVRHLANSAGALLRPSARLDLVRFGIAAYGLSPAPEVSSSADLGLVPAMTLRGRLVMVKEIQRGAGVSYGHSFVAGQDMTVGLVPMGYGDGIPRHASPNAEVLVSGRRGAVLGRICMDQFVVEAEGASTGDEVVLFGPGADGEPTAQDWAQWCGTISYEIVTRMGGRAHRSWVDG
ncbi:MAG: alanine racemase [Actinomycetota bacterium]|nr:alanine racemase [Actinomycetota bacterium]